MNIVTELAKPFPDKFVHDDGRGNAYVPHHVVTQRLIHIFGRPPRIEVLREVYDDTQNGRVLTGVVVRMSCEIGNMGFDHFVIEEVGEADNPQAKTNGARLKSAVSDAVKRCAMRMGLGLHLWAQDDYFLYSQLCNDAKSEPRNGAQGDPEDDRPLEHAASAPSHETNGDSASEGREAISGEGTPGPSEPPHAPESGNEKHDELRKAAAEAKKKDPELTAMRIALRKAAKTKDIDLEAHCLTIGTKLDDMEKSDVEALMGWVKDQ